MGMRPKTWREQAGLTLRDLAGKAGIQGTNPARTYDRYESGEQQCPAEVVEAVLYLSANVVAPADWHAVRIAFLRKRKGARR